MRVGVIQSNYIPWIGYFDFIKSVDLFVFHDDLQYTKQDWRNRNKIRVPHGTEWLTVPVKKAPLETTIDQTEISGDEWKRKHREQLRQHLGRLPYFQDALSLWESPSMMCLGEMNRYLVKRVCEYLGIKTEIIHSSELGLSGSKTDRLIDLMKKVSGKTYLSGPAARGYLEVEKMNKEGFEVEWMAYGPYKPWAQQYTGFDPYVTVLDLISSVGPEAKGYI